MTDDPRLTPADGNRTAEPIPCPVDHQCEEDEPCGCWCDLHDVPIDECPTFQLVASWLKGRDTELERLQRALDGAGQHIGQVIKRAEDAEQEAERLRAELANVQRGADTWKDAADGWEERAERLTAERDEQRQRAEQAEAATTRVRDLLPRSSVGRVYDYVLKADVLAALDASSAPETRMRPVSVESPGNDGFRYEPVSAPESHQEDSTAPTRPDDTHQPTSGQETTP